MSNFFLKYFKIFLRGYIFIFLTATLFIFFSSTKSFSEENIFTISNVEVKGSVDLNFSRDKYLNKAFIESFKILTKKILLRRDLEKISNLNLNKIKKLINSFQILEESYSKNEYKINVKIFYNESKIKQFLRQKNISFSQPENVRAVFFPILYINNEIQTLNENFFYRNWVNAKIENELINFILPLEDLDDISKINKMKNNLDEIKIDTLVNKYNTKNYVFLLMNYKEKILNIYLKTNFNDNQINKNILYKIDNINDELALNSALIDLKIIITDLWKEENLVNLLLPLSIRVKFEHKNLYDLDKIRKTFYKISIIDSYILEDFNINNSFFKIYYFGNPKKLKSELFKFGYLLKSDQGFWQIYLNE